MMLVYFHIDELARDAVVASGLKRELEKAGGRLIYGNRLMTTYILRHFNSFDAIILPSLLHYMEVFPDPENLPNNIFILQTEAIGQATGTLRRMYGKYFGDDAKKCEPWHRSVAGFLLWGYAHLNPFNEYFPAYLSKCRVVGHPRLANICIQLANKPPRKKQVVGFVSRFNLLSPHDQRTPFESIVSSMKFGKDSFPVFENSPDKDVEDMFYTEVIDFRIMLQVMLSLDSNKYALCVRPHPRENRHGWIGLARKLNMKVDISPWDEPFGHWLQKVDFIVTPPSTSLYDMFFQEMSPIVTNNVVPSRVNHILAESDDNNQILEGAYRPESVADIVAAIESGKVPFDKKIIEQRLMEQVARDIAGNSISNILTALTEINPATIRNKVTVSQKLSCSAFIALSLLLSHLRWLKWKLSGRVEQGAGFHLTAQRINWINRLTPTK